MVPIIVFRLLPYVDLPNHLAAATIFKHIGESSNQFTHFFRIEVFLKPNVLHLLFCSLDIFPSVEFANRLFLCIYAVFLPFSVLAVIRRIGGNAWFALLSPIVINNSNLSWGFVGYVMALPFMVFSFYATLKYLDDDRISSGILNCLLFLFLFFIHVQVALFAVLVYAACCFYKHRRSLSKLAADTLWALPTLTVTLVWWYRNSSREAFPAFDFQYYKTDILTLLYDRFQELFQLGLGMPMDGLKGMIISLIFTVFVFILVLSGLPRILKKSRQNANRERLVFPSLFVVIAILCFFALPHSLPGQPFVYQRVSVLVFISLIILGSVLHSREVRWWLKSAIVVVVLLNSVLWFDHYRDFNHEASSFTREVLPEDASKGRLAGLIFDRNFRGHPKFIHFPAYHIVWSKGVAVTSIVDYRFGLIRRNTDTEQLPPDIPLVGKYAQYGGWYDDMEYVLVRGSIPERSERNLQNFIPAKRDGPWTLFTRKDLE